MDQRCEPRFEVDRSVTVTVLTEPETRFQARVRNASGRGLGLLIPDAVRPGAAVRIEIDDSVVLGEAIYCRRECDGHFVGIELDQVLVGLTELGRNLAAFSSRMPVER